MLLHVPEPVILPGGSSVDVLLRLVREQLGMDVAFVTRFEGVHRRFRNVDAGIDLGGVGAGFVDEREHTFCQYIVDGRIGQVTPDASVLDLVRALPETTALGIRSYIGVPLQRDDGEAYGTLCVFSREADPDLGEREATVLRALAPVLMGIIGQEDADLEKNGEMSRAIQAVYADGGPRPVFQPVVELATGRTAGWEALSRFPAGTPGPADWFAAAAVIGQTVPLELAAIRAAVEAFDATDGFLAINVSEETIVSPGFRGVLSGVPLDRVVLEITEHRAIVDYPTLLLTLTELRFEGVRVAIDDTGAGYSTFQHVLALAPEVIKLDISLIRNIHRDHRRQALVSAMAVFALQTDSRLLAEGVETADDHACLQRLGVELGQGFHLGRPHPTTSSGHT
ncbi:MAG: EAL domain-containing protein [Aeromicrobium sp.]